MAQEQTAATANTNPSDDTARASQTNTPTPRGDNPEAVTKREEENLSSNPPSSNTQPDAVVIKGTSYSGAGGGRGSYQGYNRADEVKNKAQLALGDNKSSVSQPAVSNPLDEYSSYTYGITLFALTKDDYNTLVDNPVGFSPRKVLISSAGRYRDKRDVNFTDDFYFDSLKMTTVIGMSANSRSSNAITLDFTIIEPYGMTLLDRIMNISVNELNAKNYLDIPYLITIDFFGSDDNGNLKKIANHSKSVPIKFTSFKIKASVKGAEYAVQAVPFNHGANLESLQAIKTRMEVTSSTIAEFFDSSSSQLAAAAQSDVDTHRKKQEAYAKQLSSNEATVTQKQTADNSGAGETPTYDEMGNVTGVRTPGTAKDANNNNVQPPGPLVTKSFPAAYNAWNTSSVKNGDIKYADLIYFDIDPAIVNSKIVDPKTNSTKRVGASSATKEQQASTDKNATTLDTKSIVHDFEAGTTINEVINAILPNSEFFLSQVKDSSKAAATDVDKNTSSDSAVQDQAKTVKMWKIVPKMKLTAFDDERNVWGKEITFYIRTYDVYQQRDPRLPKSPPPNAVKRYDYFYTGQNSSVIGFDIDFNALYYNALQIDRGNTVTTAGPQAQSDDSNKDAPTTTGKANTQGGQASKRPVGTSMQTSTGGANNRSETQNAKSALESIYTSSAGDMINLKMQIIGDPHFIKQDDLFVGPDQIKTVSGDGKSVFVPGTQSLAMDEGEIYCYVTFRTPKDFNDDTGLYDLDSKNKYSVSEFSGYYKVMVVDSEFRGGKFTQTLNMVRSPEQDSPNKSASNANGLNQGDVQRNKGSSIFGGIAPRVANAIGSNSPLADSDVPKQQVTDTAAGADKDAATTVAQLPAQSEPDETKQSATEKEVANIAQNGQTIPIGDAAPVTGDPVIAPLA